MKVLITGAAGVLGKGVTKFVEQDGGYEIRLSDMLPVESKHEYVQADLSDLDQARKACHGMEAVVHCAAIHPWKKYTSDQYLDWNIKGTYNLLQAAVDSGVRKVIYTSSIAAMGYDPVPPHEPPITEAHCPNAPVENLYGVTKLVGEHFCEMFRRNNKLHYLAVRPPAFMPKDMSDLNIALGLLRTYMVADDVALGHYCALKADAPSGEAFILAADTPFQHADAADLQRDAAPVIVRYFPKAAPMLKDLLPGSLKFRAFYSNRKAKTMLGFQPKHNFQQWLEQRVG
ncbi:MAG: NAD(P)-dependent oxidoreductase [Planctomycetota bacterium]